MVGGQKRVVFVGILLVGDFLELVGEQKFVDGQAQSVVGQEHGLGWGALRTEGRVLETRGRIAKGGWRGGLRWRAEGSSLGTVLL